MSRPSRKIRIAIVGSTGRMGRALQEILSNDPAPRFELVCTVGGGDDLKALSAADAEVVIDFSAPAQTLAVADVCAKGRLPLLICTTGFTPAQFTRLRRSLARTPWLHAPNTSPGVFALCRSLAAIAGAWGPEHVVTIIETHHAAKKDAPSGTAKLIAQTLRDSFAAKAPRLDIVSLRGGNEVGEHQVIVLGPQERLEFTHRAQDRSLFAHGALKLATGLQALAKKGRRGEFSLGDVFSAAE